MVAYGLSNLGLAVPDVETPGSIPPLTHMSAQERISHEDYGLIKPMDSFWSFQAKLTSIIVALLCSVLYDINHIIGHNLTGA